MICTCFGEWDLYGLHDLYVFARWNLHDLHVFSSWDLMICTCFARWDLCDLGIMRNMSIYVQGSRRSWYVRGVKHSKPSITDNSMRQDPDMNDTCHKPQKSRATRVQREKHNTCGRLDSSTSSYNIRLKIWHAYNDAQITPGRTWGYFVACLLSIYFPPVAGMLHAGTIF